MPTPLEPQVHREAVLVKAAVRAGLSLGLTDTQTYDLLGLDARDLSSEASEKRCLHPEGDEGMACVALIRIWQYVDQLVGGDALKVRTWSTAPNAALGAVPAQLVCEPGGRDRVLAYLEGMLGGGGLD